MRHLLVRYDVCSLLFVAGVAYLVVRKVEELSPRFATAMRRFGAFGFLATAAWAFTGLTPRTPGELLGVAIVALIGAHAAALAAAVILPPLTAVADTLRSWRAAWRLETERRHDLRRQKLERWDRERAWERERPERERVEQEAAATRRLEAEARGRRDRARAECLLFYNLNAPEVGARFPRERYDEYVQSYLRDDMPAEEVERQAARLLGLVEGHLERVGKRDRPLDLAALARWYQEARAQVEALSVDERSKNFQLGKLHRRYTELVQEHLEGLKP